MQDNPFQPPLAPLVDATVRSGSSVKAVLLGLTVDVGGSLCTGIVLGIVQAFALAASGMSEEDIMKALDNLPWDSWISIMGMLLGCGFSILGGFVCARISRRRDYRLGFVLGGLSVLSGMLLGFGAYSLPLNLLLSGATLLAVLLGTRLGRPPTAA